MTNPIHRDGPGMRAVKALILSTLAIHLVMGAIATYRALVQVKDVRIIHPARELRAGDTVRAVIVTSGRTLATLVVELVQPAHAETLAVRTVPKNANPFWDPRTRSESLAVTVGPQTIARFRAGDAELRVTGTGRQQWLREPPVVVRTQHLTLVPPP